MAAPDHACQPIPPYSAQQTDAESCELRTTAPQRRLLRLLIDLLPPVVVGLLTTVVVCAPLAFVLLRSQQQTTALVLALTTASIAIWLGVAYWLFPCNGPGIPAIAWKRLLSRLFDSTLLSALASLPLVLFATKGTADALLVGYIFAGVVLLLGPFIEGAALDYGATTPGRKLFGIDLRSLDGKAQFIRRSWAVLTFGVGLGIPLISSISMARAYKRYREIGATSWDAGRFSITNLPVAPVRHILGIVLILFFWSLAIALTDNANDVARNLVAKQVPDGKTPRSPDESRLVLVPIYIEVPVVTVKVSSSKGEADAFVQVVTLLRTERTADGDLLQHYLPEIRDIVRRVMSSRSAKELRSSAGIEKSTEEIRSRANALLAAEAIQDPIKAVVFSSFTLQ